MHRNALSVPLKETEVNTSQLYLSESYAMIPMRMTFFLVINYYLLAEELKHKLY